MDCQTVRTHLSAYIDWALARPTRQQLDTHLGTCPECREELAQLETTIAWVRDLPPIEPSPAFLQRVYERIERLRTSIPLHLLHPLVGTVPSSLSAATAQPSTESADA